MAEAYEAIRARLKAREPVLLDGAIGTEIVRRGARWRQHGLRTDAATVLAVHRDYARAGADVLTTNTFQLTRRTYLNLFRDLEHMRRIGAPGLEEQAAKLARKAVELARQARDEEGNARVAIAGSISPLSHCFRPDLAPPYEVARREHAEAAALLAEADVDLLLLETMNTIDEAKAALAAAKETKLPVWVSFVPAPGGAALLGGEPLRQAAREVEALGCEAVLLNCGPPEDIEAGLRLLRDATRLPLGVYPHIGRYDPPSWKFDFHPQFVATEAWPPDRYAAAARRWRELGAAIVGGCCGTTPAHIQALREALR